RLGAPAALVEGPEALAIPLCRVAAHAPRVRHAARHHATLDLDPEIEHPLREPARRAMLERRIDVALPQVGRLDDVDVAVQHAEPVLGHGGVAPQRDSTLSPRAARRDAPNRQIATAGSW